MLTIKKPAAERLAVLCAGLLLAGCGPPGPQALLEGKRLVEQGKYPQAVEKLRRAVVLLGNTNALAFDYLGLACQQSGQLGEAETAYRRALALDPEMAEVHYNLGCLWLSQNKLEQAKAEFTTYTLGRGSSAEGWIVLGTAQLRLRELAAAERSFGEALKVAPQNPEALTDLGLVRLRRERTAEALQLFERALRAQPDYAPAILNLAILAHQSNNRPLALAKYREYLALKPPPENSPAVKTLVHELEREAATASAAPAAGIVARATNATPISKAPAGEPARPPTLPRQSQAAIAAATNPPRADAAAIPMTVVTSQQSRPVAASNKSAPATVTNTPSRSVAAASSAPPFEMVTLPAEPVFKPAQDLASDSATSGQPSAAAANSAHSGAARGATQAPAKRSLLQRINPMNLFSRDENTITSTNLKSNEQAPEPAAKAPQAASEPAANTAAPNFARYTYRSPAKPSAGNHAEAEPAFAQGLKAYEARHLPEAIRAYERATREDPSYFDAYYNLALAESEAGKLSAALAAYETALAVRPESLDARYNFGLLLKQSNYPIDAANEFEKILALYPDDPRTHLALGNLYAQQLGQPAKARQHYLKVLEVDPHNSQAAAIRYWLTK